MSMRSEPKTTQSATVPASAADDSSLDACSLPAASLATRARGIAPHAHSDPVLGVSYSGESDVSDSGKPVESSRSPVVPRSSKYLPNERTRDMRHSLFGSGDKASDEYDNSSQQSTRAPSH